MNKRLREHLRQLAGVSQSVIGVARCFATLTLVLGTFVSAHAADALAPRLVHYPLVCNPGDQCRIDCFQDGRSVLSSVRLDPEDRAELVLSDGFSDRLKPMWIEVRPKERRGNRTILMPPGVFCDLQGITIRPVS